MADELNYDGLSTKDNLTLVEELKTNFQNIYGNGETLNFDSNTPDGQLIEILAQLGTVVRQMITEVYNSCDPEKCIGAVQDSRYQINYLERKSGAFTLQNIAITTNKTVTLQGLDNAYANENASAYTVADNNGNNWYLVDTATILAGTTSLEFRAQNKGYIIPTVGTITNQVTIEPGVVSVINNVGATSIGYEEESDADFRIRRDKSTAANGKNNEDSMIAQILELDGVIDAIYHINRTNSTDSTGTAAHTLWTVVEGGANSDIANIIYANLGGSGTRGSVTIPITTSSLQTFNVNFDRETVKPLYIKFDIKPITSLGEINQNAIKTYIAENLFYKIGENAETSKVTQICADAMLADGGNGYALNVEISSGGTASASITATGITAASVVSSTFQDMAGDTTASYTFTYTSGNWQLSGNNVNLSDYGISYTGVPANNDQIIISYVVGSWTDYLAVSSIADKFTTDENKIYITAV